MRDFFGEESWQFSCDCICNSLDANTESHRICEQTFSQTLFNRVKSEESLPFAAEQFSYSRMNSGSWLECVERHSTSKLFLRLFFALLPTNLLVRLNLHGPVSPYIERSSPRATYPKGARPTGGSTRREETEESNALVQVAISWRLRVRAIHQWNGD